MPWTDDLIGRQSPQTHHHIDRCTIQQFARALRLTYAPYFDPEAARQMGYSDVIAPPTFPFTLTAAPIEGLDLPPNGIIHGEQQFAYGAPITAGDDITVTSMVQGIKRRANMVFLTIRTQGINQQGKMAFTAESLFIITVSSQEVG
ncbi:MaoC family dehydratase N-terminal domain-containing protein [Sulfobacillus sp. hq2]|uniref:FAS1-like dehydratase domain-containing protein n=1 Tax=Sulfobacillus TaxID=28033 RepID=UPI001304D845|nr:MaoC family dehydratase N-terminal domain-containing protein [Sulfobacillus sp. hq2]